MFAVYPLHLQKEIDRRWLLRSEETVCGSEPGTMFIIGGNRGSQTIGYLAAVWYGFALPD